MTNTILQLLTVWMLNTVFAATLYAVWRVLERRRRVSLVRHCDEALGVANADHRQEISELEKLWRRS